MTTVLEKLTQDLERRLLMLRADRNIHTFVLKDKSAKELITSSFATVIKGLEKKATLVDLAVTMGRRLRQKFKLSRDSIACCHIGWFILVSYFECNILTYKLVHQVKKGRTSKYPSYEIVVKSKKSVNELWELLEAEEIDLFPVGSPPAPWVSGFHVTGVGIIKKGETPLLKKLSPSNQPIFFNALNKLSRTGWRINSRVLEIYEHFIEIQEGKTPFNFSKEKDRQKRESFIIEAGSILRLARLNRDRVFYHLYNADFRGRIYPLTAF